MAVAQDLYWSSQSKAASYRQTRKRKDANDSRSAHALMNPAYVQKIKDSKLGRILMPMMSLNLYLLIIFCFKSKFNVLIDSGIICNDDMRFLLLNTFKKKVSGGGESLWTQFCFHNEYWNIPFFNNRQTFCYATVDNQNVHNIMQALIICKFAWNEKIINDQ